MNTLDMSPGLSHVLQPLKILAVSNHSREPIARIFLKEDARRYYLHLKGKLPSIMFPRNLESNN